MAVSLERLQASIIRATLSTSKAAQATPPGTTGVWSSVAGVSREGHQDGKGEDAFQPADFFCKVSFKWTVGLAVLGAKYCTNYLDMGLAFSTCIVVVTHVEVKCLTIDLTPSELYLF